MGDRQWVTSLEFCHSPLPPLEWRCSLPSSSPIVDTSALKSLLFQEPDAESVAVVLTVATELGMAAPGWLESELTESNDNTLPI